MEKSKLHAFLLSPAFLFAAEALLTAAVAVGAVFYVQANAVVYRLWKVALIDLTFVLAGGAFFTLAFFEKRPETAGRLFFVPFLVGAGLFAALFFGGQTLFGVWFDRTISSYVGVSVALSFALACLIAATAFAAKRDRRYFVWSGAAFALLVYVGALFSSLLTLPHGRAFKSFSKVSHRFETASAESYELTAEDRQKTLSWFERLFAGEGLPFDLSLGSKRLSENRSDWTETLDYAEYTSDDVRDLRRVFTHEATGVEACLIAAYYPSTVTVEWKVVVTNRGGAASPELTDLYALDASVPVNDPTLYFSGGSDESTEDFALYSRSLGSRTLTFDTVNGRSSTLYLPFFNLSGDKGGATVGIGWSGDWTASFASERGAVTARVGQRELRGCLLAGESVRTPLVSLALYTGGNPLKGFNLFRADIRRGLGEEYDGANLLMFGGAEGQDDTTRAGEAGTKAYVAALREAGLLDDLDYAWYDAGWYDTAGTGDWRGSIGDWVVDGAKYPNGFGAVSDYLEGEGVETLLWYEPERVPLSSDLYKSLSADPSRASWLIAPKNGGTDCLFNLGDEEALAFLIDRVATSLLANGVSFYRQDFNINPRAYWQSADELLYGGRVGFAENKYVTGEYAFLDGLKARIPGILIDNCASGGRRIDLEMCRRSIPLWRSDYQCKKEKTDLSEATQYQTYGLSLWLPYSSVTNPCATTEYDFRSLLGAYVMCYGDVIYDAPSAYACFVGDYLAVKEYFAENYYPLTPCTPRSDFVAMQFGTAHEGVILVYSREGSEGRETLSLNGLFADKNYRLRSISGDPITAGQGSDLMKRGFTLEVKERTAYLILYSEE
ncbi:MAG: alpha-galactosidase [Clostridia bacterium]|nr:alpha-galactosidase [Clostridia bacterium]